MEETKRQTNAKRKVDVTRLVIIAFMGGLSVLLSYYPEIPLAFFAPWLKLDFSYTPMLLMGFSVGFYDAFAVLIIKNLIRLLLTDSFGVGQLADLLMGLAILLPAVICYRKRKTRNGALIGMVIGVLMMVVVGVLANRFILFPVYMGDGFNAYMDKNPMILWLGVAPFNLVKGVSVSAITFLLYKRLSPYMKKGLRG